MVWLVWFLFWAMLYLAIDYFLVWLGAKIKNHHENQHFKATEEFRRGFD